MKDNGNEILSGEELSALNEILKENEKTELPEKLKAESIEKLVSGVAQNEYQKEAEPQKKKSKRLALRVLAGAAAFVLAFTSVMIIRPWQKPLKPALSVGERLDTKNAADYGEIEQLFCKYAASYKKYEKSLLRGLDFGVFYKSADEAAPEIADNNANSGTVSESQNNFGKTNEQVDGVSEADILKNDGKYLYAVNSDGTFYAEAYDESGESGENDKMRVSSVSILEPGNNGRLTVLSKASADFSDDESILSARAAEIYVDGDRLYMIVNIEERPDEENTDESVSNEKGGYIACGIRNTKSRTAAVCFDISNRKAPKEMWRVFQEGDCISSRITNNKLVVISNRRVNIDNTDARIKDDCIPKATLFDGSYGKIDVNDISVMEKICDASYAIVSSTDLTEGKNSFKVKAVLGGGDNVYCTESTLYVTNSVFGGSAAGDYGIIEEVFGVSSADASCTQIYKFDISDGIEYLGSTAVKGTALNQFSIDEYNGYLRIATTAGSWGDSLENYVTVINSELKTVGFIDKIAKGETIKSVRFMGDTAYVVTFEQTDPLFVIDLKDPASPAVLGELKIPGFSAYLHPVGEGLLLGVGVDGDENGAGNGMKLSLFDVSDRENPKEISKYVIEGEEKSGADGSYSSSYISSNAFYDHKALCFDENNGTVYVTYSKYERFYDPQSDLDTFSCTSGALSFKVNAEKKTLEHLNDYVVKSDDGGTFISRVTYIGDTVYTFDKEGGTVFSYDKNSAKLLFECNLRAE